MLLTSLFLTSCATDDKQSRINNAASEKAKSEQVGKSLEVANELPDQPADCRIVEKSSVINGDRLDVALLKTDKALTKANNRVRRCYTWYDNLRAGRYREREE